MKNNIWENMIKPIVVLVVICIVASAALAATNEVTAPIIAQQQAAAANAAYLEVLPEADGFEEVTDFQTSNVTKVLKATNGAGWVIQSYGKGFGGDVPVVVAFDDAGTILKVKFMENSETAGYGQKLADANDADGQKLAQSFEGQSGTLEASDVDLIGGVTVSSKAALAAVNAAVNCFNEVALGQEATVEVDTSALTPEEVRAMLAPGATLTQIEAQEGTTEVWQGDDGSYVIYAKDNGYEYASAPLNVAVGFAADGSITGVWVDASGQTAGIGDQAAGEEYLSQYVGILGEPGLDGVDTIAGATESTRGVKKAVRKAIKAYVALNPDSAAATAEESTADSTAAESEVAESTAQETENAGIVAANAEEARAALAPGATLTQVDAPEGLTEAWQGNDGSYVLFAEDFGYEYATAPMNVAVGFAADGSITGVWVDASGQTAGIGDKAADAGYLSQYMGISDEAGLDQVDTIAGATQSSRGVKKAVRKCIKAYAANFAS